MSNIAIVSMVETRCLLEESGKNSKNRIIIFNLVIFYPGACIIKLITTVIYGFHNKLECLSANTRLGWKGLPGTNTLAY